jgi:Phage integrase, N-terminal SAM-like domain
MRLADDRPRTVEPYLLAVRMFFEWAKKQPDDIDDDELRRYFAYLRDDRKLAPSSIRIALHGLRFSSCARCGATGPCSSCYLHRTRGLRPPVDDSYDASSFAHCEVSSMSTIRPSSHHFQGRLACPLDMSALRHGYPSRMGRAAPAMALRPAAPGELAPPRPLDDTARVTLR